ncbi:MAG: aminoglycoside phosphotransferase family protein [Antricoccus sp.]
MPKLVETMIDEWQLKPDGPPKHGYTSLVLPVLQDGVPAALKLTVDGDDESEHEALALTHWAGRGAVRLLRADPHRRVLLLERLDSADLLSVPEGQAGEIIGGLYRLLHRPALPKLVPVSRYTERWLGALAELSRDAPIPRRLVQQALSTGRELIDSEPVDEAVIVHGDLHYENVLAAERADWLAIDPKPMAGDPHFEPAPMLWNRWACIVEAADVRGAILGRLYTIVDAGGLDEHRARAWVLVRVVLNAHWTIQSAARSNRDLSAVDREAITRYVTIAKAVNR